MGANSCWLCCLSFTVKVTVQMSQMVSSTVTILRGTKLPMCKLRSISKIAHNWYRWVTLAGTKTPFSSMQYNVVEMVLILPLSQVLMLYSAAKHLITLEAFSTVLKLKMPTLVTCCIRLVGTRFISARILKEQRRIASVSALVPSLIPWLPLWANVNVGLRVLCKFY